MNILLTPCEIKFRQNVYVFSQLFEHDFEVSEKNFQKVYCEVMAYQYLEGQTSYDVFYKIKQHPSLKKHFQWLNSDLGSFSGDTLEEPLIYYYSEKGYRHIAKVQEYDDIFDELCDLFKNCENINAMLDILAFYLEKKQLEEKIISNVDVKKIKL